MEVKIPLLNGLSMKKVRLFTPEIQQHIQVQCTKISMDNIHIKLETEKSCTHKEKFEFINYFIIFIRFLIST